ncbi:hypothetical protein KP509_27G018200 [Ceratopteris richardii]|nr:hypothetical protein KP509_27G018200 [Ceratopteris richardii]
MIISSHAMHGDNNIAVKLYTKMLEREIIPNSNTLTCVMKSCTSLRASIKGEAIHNDIICFGFQYDLYVASALIDFYSKCGKLSKAFEVFSLLPRRNVVIWSVMMDAFIQHGCLEQSFGLLKGMYQQGIEPNEFTYSSLISACGDDVNLVEGMQLHGEFIKSGLELDSQMGSSLIDMYSKCGCLMEAQDIFDDLPNRMVSCWNALIAGYTYNGHDLAAIRLFDDMKNQGCMPNCLTLSCILKACGNLSDVEKGRAVHGEAIYTGLHSYEYVQSSLIGMYCKCGHLEEAQTVFDCSASVNIVSWGALMSGYVQHGQSCIALNFFSEIQKNGITPSIHIYSSVLKACGSLGDLQAGINVHEQICECGVEVDSYLGSSLIDMYSKCGDIEAACTVFEELPSWNVVCCGAMIAGYVQHGCPIPAFSLYEDMIFKGIIPDRVIYMYILEACAIMGSSAHGMAIHHQVVASGLHSDMVVGNALVDMYVKCDCLVEAQRIFLSLEYRNKISWDAIIVAHVLEKEIFIARKCLIKMAQEGLSVDEILFTDILAACRSNGDMKEAWNFFELMRNVYDITPSIQHFGCLINLLGDGGHLAEAEELLETMPIPPDTVAWFSLLSACRIHRNVNLGLNCFHKVMRLDPGMGVAYVTMSSIYAEAGMWESKYWIDEKRRQIDAWKIPGRAWIEVNREVHEFTVGDRTHPLTNKIYATLRRLAIVCKEEGHVPQFGSKGRSLPDGTEEFENRSEEALLGHCEKLALAFGLVSTPEGATVRIVKNLRVCTDCHSVSKIISKVERREIIINDAYHVHHFSNGECSCEKHFVSG